MTSHKRYIYVTDKTAARMLFEQQYKGFKISTCDSSVLIKLLDRVINRLFAMQTFEMACLSAYWPNG